MVGERLTGVVQLGRDSLFGEPIVWLGEAQGAKLPSAYRALAAAAFISASIAVSFVLVTSLALHTQALPTLLFAGWCLAVGIGAIELPRWWFRGMRYTVTENHVIWQRGPFRRSIEIRSISFARILWDRNQAGVGDLELVRAVPTGALQRRLTLRLCGLSAPDRVWSIIRGKATTAPAGLGARPLTQRLDHGERVLWTARPRRSWHALLPRGRRAFSLLLIAALLLASVVRIAWRMPGILSSLRQAGLEAVPFAGLVFGVGLCVGFLLVLIGYSVHEASIKPWRQLNSARYLVTNRRVLIQRGNEELHLDRDRIVEVIDTPGANGMTDLFLVLDGPRARALATSGAFGAPERGAQLRPVLHALEDAAGARRVLREPDLPRAA